MAYKLNLFNPSYTIKFTGLLGLQQITLQAHYNTQAVT